MNRVLVTGGSGLIGSHIADRLAGDSNPDSQFSTISIVRHPALLGYERGSGSERNGMNARVETFGSLAGKPHVTPRPTPHPGHSLAKCS